MALVYKQVESFVKPIEVDNTSSPSGVYIRQNITSAIRTDLEGNQNTVWSYDEAFLTTEEYKNYTLVQSTVASVELKRENAIVDEYTLTLIEEGKL